MGRQGLALSFLRSGADQVGGLVRVLLKGAYISLFHNQETRLDPSLGSLTLESSLL